MGIRIGQYLRNIVPLSELDIEEIIQEQVVSRQRFGDCALALGLCEPHHVWEAWMRQLAAGRREIDLRKTEIDTQTLGYLPAQLVRRHKLLPVRAWGNELVVVGLELPSDDVRREMQAHCLKHIVFAVSRSRKTLLHLISEHYPKRSKVA